MKTHENRSELVAHLALMDDTPNWQKPSTCRRPFVMHGGLPRQVEPREDGWRLSPDLRECEAFGDVPPDASRTFRPVYLARRVSHWPLIVATIIATTACALFIGWFVESALRSHS